VDFFEVFSESRIVSYALVGASGTGKSYQSKFVAAKYNIGFIIDDGLLIKNDKILAGRSAKEENTIIGAVRAAVFSEKARRDDVARKLQTEKFKRILILGTSEKMVRKIAARLQLPMPSKIIYIEDFAKKKEIETALRTRRVEGKHIIPLPSQEVKKVYPSIFLNALSILKGNPSKTVFIPKSHEKSLVRPAYFEQNRIKISNFALCLMIENCVFEFDPKLKIKEQVIEDLEAGYRLILTIDIPAGFVLEKKTLELEQYVTENIERFTSILIEEFYIIIDKIINII